MFGKIGRFFASVFGMAFDPAPTRHTASDETADVHDAFRELGCWFCKTTIHDANHAALPGGQKLWHVCRTCAIDATVALIVQGTLTVEEIVAACAASLERRRAAAEAVVTPELTRIRTAKLALSTQPAK